MKRKTIHVTPRPRGKWAVIEQGNSRASRTFKKKRRAVNYARKKAKKASASKGKSELKIHKRNGKIQESRSYGTDPMRYRG